MFAVLSGHLQLNMARLCSRNTKIINERNEKMIVEVTQNPGGFVDKSLTIPPGGHKYICYSDFHVGSNPDRVIDVRFYVGSATKTVSPSEIRDHGKLVLNYQDDTGTVTVTFIKGKLIPRIGYSSIPFLVLSVCFVVIIISLNRSFHEY